MKLWQYIEHKQHGYDIKLFFFHFASVAKSITVSILCVLQRILMYTRSKVIPTRNDATITKLQHHDRARVFYVAQRFRRTLLSKTIPTKE